MIDIKILELIVLNTNKRIKINKNTTINFELTIVEFKCFIGLLLLFGVLKNNKVDLDEIWSSSESSIHNVQYATASMSRNRFKHIAASLTFDDLDTSELR